MKNEIQLNVHIAYGVRGPYQRERNGAKKKKKKLKEK